MVQRNRTRIIRYPNIRYPRSLEAQEIQIANVKR